MPRHLLCLRELSRVEIESLVDAADSYAAHPGTAAPVLRGRTVAMLFYEPSTRTEISFALAAKRMGAEVVRCDVDRSSVRKGESLLDTVRTLEALGADAIVIRHSAAGASHLAARTVHSAVINAGDGMHEHPTQGLVDLLTVRQRLGRIAGLNVAIVGDIRHSRVARSAVWGFTKLGAAVTLVGPATLLPFAIHHTAFTIHGFSESRITNHESRGESRVTSHGMSVRTTTSLEEGLEGADVVMALRMQVEREAASWVPSVRELAAGYGLTEPLLARAAPGAIVMHPGPLNLGIELREDVAYGPRSVIQQQVRNGVFVRMAVLEWALDTSSTQSTRSSPSPRSQAVRSRGDGDRVAQLDLAYPASAVQLTGKTGKTG